MGPVYARYVEEKSDMLTIQKDYKQWIGIPKRARSGEVDYGVWWTLAGSEREFPRWRVSWIENTGELYACQTAKDKLIVLGVILERQAVGQVLEGWSNSESEIYHNLKALARRIEALEPVQTNG
jgi:hypothetical protein